MKDKLEKAVRDYTGSQAMAVFKYQQDPKVRGTWAIRMYIEGEFQDFLIQHANVSCTAADVEEVEFTQWPPTSGGLQLR